MHSRGRYGILIMLSGLNAKRGNVVMKNITQVIGSALFVSILFVLLAGCGQRAVSSSEDPPAIAGNEPQRQEAVLKEAETLRLSITDDLEIPSIPGAAYYVSSTGNDNNDGKSPDSAWATLERVTQADLRKGDGVLFERGGVFRGYLHCQQGVTYSAYGDGAKPVITGSPENGAKGEKWTLYGETADGGKVWQYDQDMRDCGTIVFNDGEAWGRKVAPCRRETGFVTEDGSAFDVLEGLKEDLSFFSPADSLLPAGGFIYLGDEQYAGTDGPLYLRCDRGNPGEVFESVEFCVRSRPCAGLVDMEADCLLDNLSVKYTSDSGVMPGGSDGSAVIQNCEIAWCGGGVWSYDEAGVPTLAGDGFSLASGVTISNCFIHQNYENGITIECGSDPGRVVEDVTVTGNLIDRNTGGLQIICYDDNMIAHNITFQNFLVENNYILHSGEGWAASVHSADAAPADDLNAGYSIRLGDLNSRLCAPNTVFKNNVIYSGSVCNIWGAFMGDVLPQFIDNQIYVRRGTMAALWSSEPGGEFLWYLIDGGDCDAQVLFNQEIGTGNIMEYIFS